MRQTASHKQRLTVFYDGACGVCAREMAHYRERDRERRLALVDIAAPDFDPAAFGRSREQFMAQLHVRTAAGTWLTGVAAFAAIWDLLPGTTFPLLASVVRFPLFTPFANLGYALFARVRRFLPAGREACADGSCHLGHRK